MGNCKVLEKKVLHTFECNYDSSALKLHMKLKLSR